MALQQEQGQRGEDAGRRFLLRKGYVFIERNARTKYGELDLVFRDGDELVFVEVKFRRSARFGSALDAITRTKLQRLVRAMQVYLLRARWAGPYRFDILAIEERGGEHRVEHYENVGTG